MLNRVVLIGRLTKDPELTYSKNGTAIAKFILAVNRLRLNQAGEREADFIPIIVFKKQAENCANYIGKGSLVAVDGRIQVRTYDTKEGQRRWVTEVIAESVRFLDRRGDNNNSNQGTGSFGHEVAFSDDDIPF